MESVYKSLSRRAPLTLFPRSDVWANRSQFQALRQLKRFIDDDNSSKYKRQSRISNSSPLAHARNACTRALLSPFSASLLLGRKRYLRGLHALCGFIYFNSAVNSASPPADSFEKVLKEADESLRTQLKLLLFFVHKRSACRADQGQTWHNKKPTKV